MSEHSRKAREAFSTHFETLGLDERTLVSEMDETIVPERGPDHGHDDALKTLPQLKISSEAARAFDKADLRWMGTLGEGGMGLVRLANQVPLDREVAVKTLRESAEERAARALLQEAYVTGHLEHPNIVPIYTLGRDSEGAPLIVMKRIEGTSWDQVIQAPEAYHDPVDLDWHLNILKHVCNALRFAHSKGIIHRDIKPENIMIGHFGEVYLLDWGIAVSTTENGPLPWRERARGIAGTPAYMAPEMTRDIATQVDERTDVYLLGATLHEIITGETRHQGPKLFDVMFSAFESLPSEYDDDVPAELGAIANRACHKDPEQRFQSVDEFREAVAAYQEHRESVILANEARERLVELERLVKEATHDESDALRIHDVFGECRFGFRQALRMWAENTAARAGLQRALEDMLRHHIATRNLIGAQTLITELPDPNPELSSAIDDLANDLANQERELERLKEFADDMDLRRGARARSRLAIILGVLWTLSTLSVYHTYSTELLDNHTRLEHHLDSVPRSLLIAGVGVFLFRKRIFTNVANRRVVYILLATLVSMSVMRLATWWGQVDIVIAQSTEQVLYAFAVFAVAVLSDLRIALLSLIYFTSAIAGLLLPDGQLLIAAVSNVLIFGGLAWIWSPRQTRQKVAA